MRNSRFERFARTQHFFIVCLKDKISSESQDPGSQVVGVNNLKKKRKKTTFIGDDADVNF